MSIQTTFAVLQQLLKESCDANTSLSTSVKTALKARVDALSKTELVTLGANEVDSVVGLVSVGLSTDSITVALGAPPSENRVVFELVTFDTPVRIDGTVGTIGALLGHTGHGVNAAVATADIALYYRFATTGSWVVFDRNVVLDNVSSIQFSAVIAEQLAAGDLPQLHIVATQL